MFFFLQNSPLLFSITRSSSFSVIHVSVNIKNNVEKDKTLLLFFISTSPGGHAISFQIKRWVAFGLPYLLVELFYIGSPVVRTDGRCTVTWLPNFLGWVVYHIFSPMVLPRARFARQSSAIRVCLEFQRNHYQWNKIKTRLPLLIINAPYGSHFITILEFFIIRWKKLAVVDRLFQHSGRSFSGRCLCGEAAVVGGLNKSEWMYSPPGQTTSLYLYCKLFPIFTSLHALLTITLVLTTAKIAKSRFSFQSCFKVLKDH